jgi:hypothetical protein
MAQVVERPNVVGDPGGLQGCSQLGGEPRIADLRPAVGMTEDEVVVALVRGLLIVGGERVGEDGRERDGAFPLLAFRLDDPEYVLDQA